jgi:hypothetical protein
LPSPEAIAGFERNWHFISAVFVMVRQLLGAILAPMLRAAAVALAALAAFDYFYCDGWYTHAAEAIALNSLHLITG